MKKSLVLAEKPSVGRDIARVLGCHKKEGYYESNQYIVTWALGHLVTLATPDKYNKSYDKWTLEMLPVIPKPFKLEVIKNTSRQYYLVKRLMERDDVKDIIIGTDAGREGELVARWIIEYGRCKKPLRRLWISSVTDKAIKEGFSNLKEGKKYNSLYYAAKARAEADWIVGLNGTRALTCKHNASLSMGRVQTPTVEMIAEREKEIQNFKPNTYYEVITEVKGIKCKWFNKSNGQTRIYNKEKAEDIFKKIKQKGAIVKKFQINEKKKYSSGFYDLTELQRDANRIYGFSAKETLNIMQSLYEKHKVLTYPRTDSKYITKDIVATLPERVQACRNTLYKEVVGKVLREPMKGNTSYVNDAKVGDHHGIIPTEQLAITRNFVAKELKIYNLVVQKFLAALLPPYRYYEVSIEIEIEGYSFKGTGTQDIDIGWKVVYEGNSNSIKRHASLIKLSIGDKVEAIGTKIDIGKTQPPSYFTEGELLHEMEKSGLGTVATRSDIIEKIVANAYIDKQDKFLRTTKTGKQLLTLVPDDIKSKELTAKWEKDLEAIVKGRKSNKEFINEMIQFTHKIIQEIKSDTAVFRHENVSSEACPKCGQKLLVIDNKYGKKLVCRDRNCGYKKKISMKTNARCPNCHKKMEVSGEGEKKIFFCQCGHKEKLESFQKRKAERANQMSKKDVQRFLNKNSNKDENINNPFANILKDVDIE